MLGPLCCRALRLSPPPTGTMECRLLTMMGVKWVLLVGVVAASTWGASHRSGASQPELARAVRLMDAGDWPQAEHALKALLRSTPSRAEALNLLGVVTEQLGRTDE